MIKSLNILNNKIFGHSIIICFSSKEKADNPYDSKNHQLDITKAHRRIMKACKKENTVVNHSL